MNITLQAEPVSEYALQSLVCLWLRCNYPGLIFFSDLSGVRLTKGVAGKIKALKCGRGIPDLWIIKRVGNYPALVLELKTVKNSPYLKDGGLSRDKHVQEQWAIIQDLIKEGYCAMFSVGYSQTIELIKEYLSFGHVPLLRRSLP
jgi:hypothetical protein